MKNPGLLIFTDLDGTLLDHESYSWAPAAPALAKLRELQVPVILNSSKTAAEIEGLRSALGNDYPYVTENGGGLVLPAGTLPNQVKTETGFLGRRYAEILEILGNLRLKKNYLFKGFADLGVAGVSEATGLNPAAARLACARESSEPLIWLEDDARLEEMRSDLAVFDLQLVQGGRFQHVMGANDKGKALSWIFKRYRLAYPDGQLTTVALGDGENDRPMLEAADIAVVIRPHQGQPLWLRDHRRVIRPIDKGPQGWQEAISEILRIYL